ncbi:MAG: hypothetical protein ACK40K_03505 [Raineya sp.]
MKYLVFLLFFIAISLGRVFAQDTTDVEKEIPTDTLNNPNDTLNTELKIEPSWETNEEK